MAPTNRIIACRSDPKVTLTNGTGKAMLNITFETDAPPLQPPAKPLVVTLAMPHDTTGDVVMDKIDPRLPIEFKFSNVMSLRDSSDTISCMLFVEIPRDLQPVPIRIVVSDASRDVLAEEMTLNVGRISLMFDAIVRG